MLLLYFFLYEGKPPASPSEVLARQTTLLLAGMPLSFLVWFWVEFLASFYFSNVEDYHK